MVEFPTFDGHNDVALRLYWTGRDDPAAAFLEEQEGVHLDLPKARAGGYVGGFFALFAPSSASLDFRRLGVADGYEFAKASPLDPDAARATVMTMLSLLLRLEGRSEGAFRICRSGADIRAAIDQGAIAAVVHLEGAEAIDGDLHALDVLHAAGVRSIGPVWSRDTIFAEGVNTKFPGSPDCGAGLTSAGKRLVRACNEKGVVIDLSHMNEKGFWDVARLSTAPLVATHSNVHALCPHSRNLTRKQLDAIRESRGVVGLCLATSFLRNDGNMREDTDVELVVRHCDALLATLGEDGVAIGTDFEGCIVPQALRSAAELPALYGALRRHGYDDALLNKISHLNWLDLLERTIG